MLVRSLVRIQRLTYIGALIDNIPYVSDVFKARIRCSLTKMMLLQELTVLEVAELPQTPLNELQEVEAKIHRLGELMETIKMKC